MISKKIMDLSKKRRQLSGNAIDYDNIDEKLCEIHNWFKFLKFGFGDNRSMLLSNLEWKND